MTPNELATAPRRDADGSGDDDLAGALVDALARLDRTVSTDEVRRSLAAYDGDSSVDRVRSVATGLGLVVADGGDATDRSTTVDVDGHRLLLSPSAVVPGRRGGARDPRHARPPVASRALGLRAVDPRRRRAHRSRTRRRGAGAHLRRPLPHRRERRLAPGGVHRARGRARRAGGAGWRAEPDPQPPVPQDGDPHDGGVDVAHHEAAHPLLRVAARRRHRLRHRAERPHLLAARRAALVRGDGRRHRHRLRRVPPAVRRPAHRGDAHVDGRQHHHRPVVVQAPASAEPRDGRSPGRHLRHRGVGHQRHRVAQGQRRRERPLPPVHRPVRVGADDRPAANEEGP